MKKKIEPMWCCKECGGTNVERLMWVDYNSQVPVEDASNLDKDTWCRDCENHTGVMLKSSWESQNGKE